MKWLLEKAKRNEEKEERRRRDLANGPHLLGLSRREGDGAVGALVGLLGARDPGDGVVRLLDAVGDSPDRGLRPGAEGARVLEPREDVLHGLIWEERPRRTGRGRERDEERERERETRKGHGGPMMASPRSMTKKRMMAVIRHTDIACEAACGWPSWP